MGTNDLNSISNEALRKTPMSTEKTIHLKLDEHIPKSTEKTIHLKLDEQITGMLNFLNLESEEKRQTDNQID